jgi:photosystem II stability/assembly factor-like uncharacterized protein
MKNKPTFHSMALLFLLFYQGQTHSQWIAQNSPTTLHLDTVHFFDSNIGLVSGGYTLLYKTTDGGTTWSSLGNYSAQNFSFVNATTGYSTTVSGQPIKKTTDSGATWGLVTPPTSASFLGVFAISPTSAYFINAEDKVLKTTDGGNTFFSRTIVLTTPVSQNLTDVFFTDTNTGYLTAQGARNIWKTTNAGITWNFLTTGTTVSLNCIYFVTPLIGYAAGESGKVLKTMDAGTTWVDKSTGGSHSLNAMEFVDADNGIIVGNGGVIYRTVNGGNSWISEGSGTTSNLNTIFYITSTNAMIVGDNGTILKKTNLPLSDTDRIKIDKFTLYPNPANDIVTIETNQTPIKKIELFDIQGRLITSEVMSTITTQHQIYISQLVNGTYFIKLTTEDGAQNMKLLKN